MSTGCILCFLFFFLVKYAECQIKKEEEKQRQLEFEKWKQEYNKIKSEQEYRKTPEYQEQLNRKISEEKKLKENAKKFRDEHKRVLREKGIKI